MSYSSCCWDKIPLKSNLMKESFVWAHALRLRGLRQLVILQRLLICHSPTSPSVKVSGITVLSPTLKDKVHSFPLTSLFQPPKSKFTVAAVITSLLCCSMLAVTLGDKRLYPKKCKTLPEGGPDLIPKFQLALPTLIAVRHTVVQSRDFFFSKRMSYSSKGNMCLQLPRPVFQDNSWKFDTTKNLFLLG